MSLLVKLSIYLNLVYLNLHLVHGVRGTPGWVVPSKVELPIGSDLNISCTIDPVYLKQAEPNGTCNVSQLYFKTNTEVGNTREEITFKTERHILRINDTTILFRTTNLTEQDSNYVCMCGPFGIDTTDVHVGTKPSKVEDFNCTSYDWDYMFCNFTAPKNSIWTTYNVSFETQKNSSYRYFLPCNFDASPVVNCNITGETYKKFSEHYFFRLDVSNSLGKDQQYFEVNNVERMILARPGQNLNVLNITKDSICISWDMPRRTNFVGGVLWQVHVIPENYPPITRSMWRNSSSAYRDTMCLTELPYAGYTYVLELRVRNNKTKSRWSKPLLYQFRTASERPDRPPRITNGSFYIYSSESQLTVYWEQLEKQELNGDNFTYVISEYRVNDTYADSSKVRVDANSATIENWNQTARHELFIRSRNEVGTSLEASHLVIPSISNEDFRLRVPKKIRSVYHSSNSSYTVSWKAPEDTTDLINYTVFWCNSKPAVQSKCNASIHFEHVSSDKLQFTTRSSHPISLNMAVSANYGTLNTGMHWMSCSRDVYDDLAKMEPSIEKVTNSSITVKWSTERVCPAILSGYNLTYCQRSNGKPDNCTTKVLDPNSVAYVIQNLEPYTYYSVKMFMYSSSRASKYSDELINQTSEAAPSQPRQLEYTNVSSTRAIITWRPPIKANGVVRAYEGIYRHDNKTDYFNLPASTDELIDNDKLVVYELGNLTAYTQYEVSIRAKTLYSSEPSNVITFRTAVGVPTPPMLNRPENIQQSTRLEWMAPQRAAGRLEFYEIKISEYDANNTRISELFSYIGSAQNLTCKMITPVCTPLHRFHYQVRAVNAERLQVEEKQPVVEKMSSSLSQTCVAQLQLNESAWSQIQAYQNPALYRLHKSGWSTHEVSCSPETNHARIVVLMTQMIILIVISAVTVNLVYRKVRKMSDIDLVLPPGIMEELKKPIENRSMGTDSISGGGPGLPSGGIICTRVDTAPQYLPQYSPQDAPHDFNSGSESSKLLLANSSSSGGVYDDHLHHRPPMSYMTMKLFDDETPTTATGQGTELHDSRSPLNNANVVGGGGVGGGGGGNNTGYIKPTQMKNWTAANTLDNSPAMPLSGYVPVQVLQARNTPTAAVAGLGAMPTMTPQPPTATPMHMLSSSNYVQASDLHKLKPMPPPTATFSTPPAAPIANSFGYTAMEQLQRNGLMKPVAPPTASTTQPAQTAAGGQQNQQLHRLPPQHIGGYVTPQDLNALAHNRHMM